MEESGKRAEAKWEEEKKEKKVNEEKWLNFSFFSFFDWRKEDVNGKMRGGEGRKEGKKSSLFHVQTVLKIKCGGGGGISQWFWSSACLHHHHQFFESLFVAGKKCGKN